MKFNEYVELYETPALIDYSYSDISDIYTYDKLMKRSRENIGYYNDYTISTFMKGRSLVYCILDDENKKILFVSHITKTTLNSKTYFVQELLFRDKGIDKEVVDYMFNLELDDIRTIVSDNIHTKGSKHFWNRMIAKYIGKSRYEVGVITDIETLLHKDDWESEFEHYYIESDSRFFIRQK